MKIYLSPNGTPIVATKVWTPGRCDIIGIDDNGVPEYDGSGTTHFYDDQVPATENQKQVFLDDDGAEWTFDQLTPQALADGPEPGGP